MVFFTNFVSVVPSFSIETEEAEKKEEKVRPALKIFSNTLSKDLKFKASKDIEEEKIGTYTIATLLTHLDSQDKDGGIFDRYFFCQQCNFAPKADVASGKHGKPPFLTKEYIIESQITTKGIIVNLPPDKFSPNNEQTTRVIKTTETCGGSVTAHADCEVGFSKKVKGASLGAGVKVEAHYSKVTETQRKLSDLKTLCSCGEDTGIVKWSYSIYTADKTATGGPTGYLRHQVVDKSSDFSKGSFTPKVEWTWEVKRDPSGKRKSFDFETRVKINFTEIRRPNPALKIREEGPYKLEFLYKIEEGEFK